MATGQWWVILPLVGASNGTATVVQSAQNPGGGLGPYATKAAAQTEATRYNNAFGLSNNVLKAALQIATGNTKQSSNPLDFSLNATGISGWFFRGLKVLFGGILMILAVSHLTGLSNKVTQVAGNALPLLAA